MKKQAFTLVELIVVITILAILGTIAFISLQGYSTSARDSTRLSDISNIKKTLELYKIDNGKYPVPDNSSSVTYSGSIVWGQGVFGENVFKKVQKISNIPLDPLSKVPYTYSLLNTKKEFEIGAVFEGELSKSNSLNTYANGTKKAKAYITGTYNGVSANAYTGGITYVLAIPSIINSDPNLSDILDIIGNNKLSYNGKTVLPGGYVNTEFDLIGDREKVVNVYDIVIFEGDLENISSNDKQNIVQNIEKAYSGTTIVNESEIEQALAIDSSDLNKVNNYTNNIVNNDFNENSLLTENEIENGNSGSSLNGGGDSSSNSQWKDVDSNCDLDDFKIGNQIWAGCNSTLGTSTLEYTDVCTNSYYGGTSIDNSKCLDPTAKDSEYSIGSSKTVGNIWGQMYNKNNDYSSGICPEGWKIPSENDWVILATYLNSGVNCYTYTDQVCPGLGLKNHELKTSSNNIVQALKLPASGKMLGGSTGRGKQGYYAVSDRGFFDVRDYIDTFEIDGWSMNGISVRCIKE